MEKIFVFFSFAITISIQLNAQQQTPQILMQPASWQFERFALPPNFAPGIPFHGAEELRFSPGMFNKDSLTYFSYAFVAQLDDVTTISRDEIKNYLIDYMKGLCIKTAKDKKLVIDTTKIFVDVEKKNDQSNNIIYNAALNIFGVFADGAPVHLNMEIKVLKNEQSKKIYLLFIASPQEKTNSVWKELYKVQKEFRVPG